jgi:hypothetical protein
MDNSYSSSQLDFIEQKSGKKLEWSPTNQDSLDKSIIHTPNAQHDDFDEYTKPQWMIEFEMKRTKKNAQAK